MEEIDLEYEQFLKSLGARIKQLRNERNWSLRDMVIQHGYHDSQWRRYERGGAINVQSLLKIAKVFHLSLAKLLDGLGEYPQKPVSEIAREKAPAKQTSAGKTKKRSGLASSTQHKSTRASVGETKAKIKSSSGTPKTTRGKSGSPELSL